LAIVTERFGLNWLGRAEAESEAAAPPRGALTPAPEQSVLFETAPHRFIEGDNLAVLKRLRETHAGAVRVIYIDPPYNTGQGMRYHDNFRMAGRGSDSGDRRHANWLSMIWPRLLVARDLLRDDGVIFVSIDDNETHHMRLLLDAAFGEENFVSTVTWRKKVVRGRGARHVLPQTEYIHVYAKQLSALEAFSEPLTDEMVAEYKQRDALGPYKLIPLAKSGTSHSPRPNLVYAIPAPDGTSIACPTHQWRWSRETLEAKRDEIVFKKKRDGQWAVFTKQRLVIEGTERRRTPISYYDRATTTTGTEELKALFGEVVIDFPKPSRLIKDLIAWATPEGGDDWVLDFFAGSCPTAQAVLELNREDGGTRRFLCVQRPEELAHPEFATIAEIGKERIRRVIARMEAEGEPGLGFQVYTFTD
jgi:adenine-specific DNA-methyltransferase